MSEARHATCHLLKLPVELRLYIYELVFGSLSNNRNEITKAQTIYCLALLQINEQMRDEASHTLLSCAEELIDRFKWEKEFALNAGRNAAQMRHDLMQEDWFGAASTMFREVGELDEGAQLKLKRIDEEQERHWEDAMFYHRMAGRVRRWKKNAIADKMS